MTRNPLEKLKFDTNKKLFTNTKRKIIFDTSIRSHVNINSELANNKNTKQSSYEVWCHRKGTIKSIDFLESPNKYCQTSSKTTDLKQIQNECLKFSHIKDKERNKLEVQHLECPFSNQDFFKRFREDESEIMCLHKSATSSSITGKSLTLLKENSECTTKNKSCKDFFQSKDQEHDMFYLPVIASPQLCYSSPRTSTEEGNDLGKTSTVSTKSSYYTISSSSSQPTPETQVTKKAAVLNCAKYNTTNQIHADDPEMVSGKKFSDFSISFLLNQKNSSVSRTTFHNNRTSRQNSATEFGINNEMNPSTSNCFEDNKLTTPSSHSPDNKQETSPIECHGGIENASSTNNSFKNYKMSPSFGSSDNKINYLSSNENYQTIPTRNEQCEAKQSKSVTGTPEYRSQDKAQKSETAQGEPYVSKNNCQTTGKQSRKRRSTEKNKDSSPKDEHSDTNVSPSKRKMARFKYRHEQLDFLKTEFLKNRYPSYDDLVHVSREVDVPVRQLQIWFQNKRASTTGTRKPKSTQIRDSQTYQALTTVSVSHSGNVPGLDQSSYPTSFSDDPTSLLTGGSSHYGTNKHFPLPDNPTRFQVTSKDILQQAVNDPSNLPGSIQNTQRMILQQSHLPETFYEERIIGNKLTPFYLFAHEHQSDHRVLKYPQVITHVPQTGAQSKDIYLASYYNYLLNKLNNPASNHDDSSIKPCYLPVEMNATLPYLHNQGTTNIITTKHANDIGYVHTFGPYSVASPVVHYVPVPKTLPIQQTKR